jgi:lipoate synthase
MNLEHLFGFYFSFNSQLSNIVIELPVTTSERSKKPEWLKVKLPTGENYRAVRNIVDEFKLHTIYGRMLGCRYRNFHDFR